MFVERKVCYSALFTNLVVWHTGTDSFPPSDVILAQLACPLSDVMFYLHSGRTNLSPYKPCRHVGCPVTNPIKKFTTVNYGFFLQVSVLVPGKPFQPSLMFSGEA
jgi:hypothetical protein